MSKSTDHRPQTIDYRLKEAIEFHGHLGPWLVLGLLIGEAGLKKLKAKKYFGVETIVWGATERPQSCLVDGLQLSTGCTYGKGNIKKVNSNSIKVILRDCENKKSLRVVLKKDLLEKLNTLKGHKDSESFAHKLLTLDAESLFEFTL